VNASHAYIPFALSPPIFESTTTSTLNNGSKKVGVIDNTMKLFKFLVRGVAMLAAPVFAGDKRPPTPKIPKNTSE
jgi:hypothetical protein